MRVLRPYVMAVDRLSRLVGRAVSWLMPALVLALCYEVFARYALAAPTSWAMDAALYLFAAVGMLGGAAALAEGAHIEVDVLTSRMRPRLVAALQLISAPLIVWFLVLVVLYMGDAALDALANGDRRPTRFAPPLWPLWALVPLGAGLLMLQLSATVIRAACLAITGRPLIATTADGAATGAASAPGERPGTLP